MSEDSPPIIEINRQLVQFHKIKFYNNVSSKGYILKLRIPKSESNPTIRSQILF